MTILIALLEALLFVYICRNSIRKHPGVFYVLSIAIIAFCVCYERMNLYSVFPEWTYTYIISVFWRGAFSTALFVIVMYIGALDRKSKIVKALMPIRGYLSIIACLITLAHSFAYGVYYIPTMIYKPQELDLRGLIALIITAPLFFIMIILMVTSFIKVRRKMKPQVWKKVQRLAYPWFALLYLYLMVLFIPRIIESFNPASDLEMFYRVNYVLSATVYTLVFGGYFILRIMKYQLDKVR
jgi:DMSO/TMAO reductase YedYZ heme-binding membrane subunit